MSIDEKLTFIVGRRVYIYIYIYIYIYTHIYIHTLTHTHTYIYERERENMDCFYGIRIPKFFDGLG